MVVTIDTGISATASTRRSALRFTARAK